MGLTNYEMLYLAARPHHAYYIAVARDLAFEETARRFGRNGRNDPSDAFRHCYWSALLARDLGRDNALFFTTAHEESELNPPREREMDLHNNWVGICIGSRDSVVSPGRENPKRGTETIAAECFAALQAGKLTWLESEWARQKARKAG